MSVKAIQRFLLESNVRCKFRIHPTEPRIIFRVTPAIWWRIRGSRKVADVDPLAIKFWSLRPEGIEYVILPLLMPWECREQIAVYTYLD